MRATIKAPVLAVLLFGVGVIFKLLYRYTADFDDLVVTGDAGRYLVHGFNLVENWMYSYDRTAPFESSSRVSPGYPYFIALIYLIIGDQVGTLKAIGILQILLSATVPVVLFYIAIRFSKPIVAFVCLIVFSIYPHQVVNAPSVLTETIFSLLLSLTTLALILSVEKRSLVLVFVAGSLLGYATLVRPITLLFAPFLFLLVLRYDLGIRRSVLMLCALTALFWAPWAIWSEVVADRKESNARLVVTLGSYPDHTYKEKFGYPHREDPSFKHNASSWANLVHSIKEKFIENPGQMTYWYLLGKPQSLWQFSMVQGNGGPYIYPVKETMYERPGVARTIGIIMSIVHKPFFYLTILSSILILILHCLGKKHINNFALLLSVSFVVYATLFHIPFAALPRFSIPFQGFVFLVFIAIISNLNKRLSPTNNLRKKEALKS